MRGPTKPVIPVIHREKMRQFWEREEQRATVFSSRMESRVRTILRAVALRGDEAILEHLQRIDGVRLSAEQIPISTDELRECAALVDSTHLMDFEKVIFHITAFHRRQIQRSWEFEHDGVLLGQRISPMRRVGLHVPGGMQASPSAVLMAAIPAKVAGVEQIAVVTPPGTLRSNPSVAAVLSLLGIREIYQVGGAPAIAALAFGTETIPAVDKIIGPGNDDVTLAKRMVFEKVDVDRVTGPTELLIVADESASPKYIAADLVSQAEHHTRAAAVCITDSLPHAILIQVEAARQLRGLPRRPTARKSLLKYGAVLVVETLGEATEIVNRFAPAQLELLVENPARFAAGVAHAGTIFYGSYTPKAVGEFFAGPSHILPSHGTARFSSPLCVHDYVKLTNIVRYTRNQLQQSRESLQRLATVEGLQGHARSVAIRFEDRNR